MQWMLRVGLVLVALTAEVSSCACESLMKEQTLQLVVSKKASPCVLIKVGSNEAVQVSVNQPVDLNLRAVAFGADVVVSDGFDFGEESITLVDAGEFRITIHPNSPSLREELKLVMTSKSLPLQPGREWRSAENAANVCKDSDNREAVVTCLSAWIASGDVSRIARTKLRLGSAALHSGDAAAAREAYEEALQLCEELHDVRCRAEAANNSGLAARRLGDIDQARLRLEQAGADWRQIALREEAAVTLSNLGLLLWQTGDFHEAIVAYDRARGMLGRRDELRQARILNNLGLCYLSLAEYDKALAYFDRALRLFLLHKSTADEVRARLNLGRARMLNGSLRAAQAQLEIAVARSAKIQDRSAKADARNNLGQVLLLRGMHQDAEEMLRPAHEIYRSLRDRRGEASTLHYLGLVQVGQRQLDRGRELLQKGLQLRRQTGLRNDAAASLLALAEVERDAGNLAAARSNVDESLGIIEVLRRRVPGSSLKASYFAGLRRTFDVLVDIVMRTEDPHRAEAGLLAAERGRAQALLDAILEPVKTGDVPPELERRRREIQQKLDYLSARVAASAGADEGALKRQVEMLLAEDEEVQARIQAPGAPQARARQQPTLARLQDALPKGTCLLEYHLGAERSYLWFVDSERILSFVLPSRQVIQAQVAHAANLFAPVILRRRSPQRQQEFEAALHRLSATLFGPLTNVRLPDRVLIVPDGALHSVAFAALRAPGDRRPLGLRADVVQLPAAAYLLNGPPSRPLSDFPRAVLALADPVFSADDPRVNALSRGRVERTVGLDLGRLAFGDEMNTLTRLLPAPRREVLRGFEVNAQALRRIRLGDFGLIHLSTHALVDNAIPELSRIALSLVTRDGEPVDGLLGPDELARWSLNGSVVVLSACQTAKGKQVVGEGVVGLASSLLYAGASQLIATLANVDDEASSVFFSEVYRQMFSGQAVRTEHAMTLARQALARSSRWSDPYYWASFVVIGRASN